MNKKILDIDFSHADHIADVLLGARHDRPRPIFTPIEVRFPNGFGPRNHFQCPECGKVQDHNYECDKCQMEAEYQMEDE